MKVEIHKNFLEKQFFLSLKSLITNQDFPWRFRSKMTKDDAVWQFQKKKKLKTQAKLYKLKVIKGGKDAGK